MVIIDERSARRGCAASNPVTIWQIAAADESRYRGIGRFLGNGICPVIDCSSVTADARVFGARLRIAAAASSKAAAAFSSSSLGGGSILVAALVLGLVKFGKGGSGRC